MNASLSEIIIDLDKTTKERKQSDKRMMMSGVLCWRIAFKLFGLIEDHANKAREYEKNHNAIISEKAVSIRFLERIGFLDLYSYVARNIYIPISCLARKNVFRDKGICLNEEPIIFQNAIEAPYFQISTVLSNEFFDASLALANTGELDSIFAAIQTNENNLIRDFINRYLNEYVDVNGLCVAIINDLTASE